MVFKKLLAGLGFGGVEADTILAPQPAHAGGQLTGQVNLRAKSDTDITSITLILVAQSQSGEVELGRFQVSGLVRIPSGAQQSVPFSVALPAHTPFTVLFEQDLPGMQLGVRTELAVASGKAKGDFDPVRVQAASVHEHIMDTLGLIGCRFVRSEIRPGQAAVLNVPAAQAVTFFAPIPEGQQPGPHIPLITFTLSGNNDGITVLAELYGRPGVPDRHELSAADISGLTSTDGGWSGEIDRWLINTLDKLGQATPSGGGAGGFMQPHTPSHQAGYGQQGYGHQQHGHGHGQPGYAYGGHSKHGSYKYGGYHGKPSMGGALAMGVGGAALGFLGGMMLGDMLGDAFSPDEMAGDAMADAGIDDPSAGMEDMGGGYDDFGGGDFGEF
jgi:sporulation-control protein